MYIHTYIYICTHICLYMHMIHVVFATYVHTHICMCIYIYIYRYIYIHIHTYMYIKYARWGFRVGFNRYLFNMFGIYFRCLTCMDSTWYLFNMFGIYGLRVGFNRYFRFDRLDSAGICSTCLCLPRDAEVRIIYIYMLDIYC